MKRGNVLVEYILSKIFEKLHRRLSFSKIKTVFKECKEKNL